MTAPGELFFDRQGGFCHTELSFELSDDEALSGADDCQFEF